jgi:hypothetical protein
MTNSKGAYGKPFPSMIWITQPALKKPTLLSGGSRGTYPNGLHCFTILPSPDCKGPLIALRLARSSVGQFPYLQVNADGPSSDV